MTSFKQALAELENNGVAAYRHGTPVSSAYVTIDGTHYNYNKFKDERMSVELRKAIEHSHDKFKQQNNNNNNDNNKQEEASIKSYLNYLLQNDATKQEHVKWGNGYRNVVIIEGNKYQYKGGDTFNKNLENKIVSLYISMSNKSSNKNKKKLSNTMLLRRYRNYIKRISKHLMRNMQSKSSLV